MAMEQIPNVVAISSSVPAVRMQTDPIMDQCCTRAQAVTWLSHSTLYYQSGHHWISLQKERENVQASLTLLTIDFRRSSRSANNPFGYNPGR